MRYTSSYLRFHINTTRYPAWLVAVLHSGCLISARYWTEKKKKKYGTVQLLTTWILARRIPEATLVLFGSIYPAFSLITLLLEELPRRFITAAASNRNDFIRNLTAYPKNCSHSGGYSSVSRSRLVTRTNFLCYYIGTDVRNV